MLNKFLLQKIDERFRFFVFLMLKIDVKKFRRIELNLNQKPQYSLSHLTQRMFKIVDYLEHFEASLLNYLLLEKGLIRGVDFEIFSTPYKKFILTAKPNRKIEETLKILDKIRFLSQTKNYAAKILDEWQVKENLKPGNVDEALYLGYEILKEKNKVLVELCPKCGKRSPNKVYERIDGENYVVYVRKLCCGYIIRKNVPIKRKI